MTNAAATFFASVSRLAHTTFNRLYQLCMMQTLSSIRFTS